ncbi:MAG TPA: HAMP domain-containing sensor histidine kinase [Bryobacteraceae bacterium]|nr:HAMP domain-containing sensor histidine kinase [Bryobacteraceae bacterium]
MNRLRNRLILIFALATLAPLAVTTWIFVVTASSAISRWTSIGEVDRLSKSLEKTGLELYQRACESLKQDAAAGRASPQAFRPGTHGQWPVSVQEFFAGGEPEHFTFSGPGGDRLDYLVRRGDEVWMYSSSLHGVGMLDLSQQYAHARALVEDSSARNLRRGFAYTFLGLTAAIWIVAFLALVYFSHRISRPIQQLTTGLSEVAAGRLDHRVATARHDEIGAAIQAFNNMAEQLKQSQERLVYVTRLESWQALARKMAHEIKNSLTPIRLTMEEIAARQAGPGNEFFEQAAQIVVDEVLSLERRVRAFSEFSSEPPVSPKTVDVNSLLEERIALLRAAHPEVVYSTRLAPDRPKVYADEDLIKGVLTNLLENAAQAVKPGGVVLGVTTADNGKVTIEVHDSGPGVSAHARGTLFEPTISFKRGGMGLGLSIARKSALLAGGDIVLVNGELGGAAFRVQLPAA